MHACSARQLEKLYKEKMHAYEGSHKLSHVQPLNATVL